MFLEKLQNMTEEKNSNKLLQLRKRIDKIDDAIIDLLKGRIDIVHQVKEYKENIGEKLFVKSAREADMVKQIVRRLDSTLPKSAALAIWRKIISSSNHLEQDLQIAIHNPHQIADYQYLVNEYYGDYIKTVQKNDAEAILQQMVESKIDIAAFSLSAKSAENDSWWQILAENNDNINIFAQIPFIKNKKQPHRLVVAAIKEPEKSAADLTLVKISCHSKEKLQENLQKSGFEWQILQKLGDDYLLEIEGFLEDSASFNNDLGGNNAKILGHMATMIDS